jgi:hypothetical protein
MKLKSYEKLCLYVQVFVAALMFSIFYENTKFTFGSVVDIHSQFEEWHIALLVIGIFDLFGMQWAKNKSYSVRLETGVN